MTEKRIVNETEIEALCQSIAASIKNACDVPVWSKHLANKQEFPVAIIAPVRGGLIPGVYMSHLLGIPLFPINYSLRDHKADLEIPTSFYHYMLNHTGKTVLLVDDIVDTGDTFRGITEAFDHFEGVDLITAALFTNTESGVRVDYSGELLKRSEDERWYDFFWEKTNGN